MDGNKTVETEVCEAEFLRFVEAMDLDVDPRGMDDEDKHAFEASRRSIIRAMERGALVIDEHGQPVFTPSKGEPLTFHEPTGADRMQMDEKKQGHAHRRVFTLLASMTKSNVQRFAAMPQRDLKVCEAFISLFLGG